MRRIMITTAAAAIALGGLLGGAGVASADPDVTAQQCRDGGGIVIYQLATCWGGKYDGHSVKM